MVSVDVASRDATLECGVSAGRLRTLAAQRLLLNCAPASLPIMMRRDITKVPVAAVNGADTRSQYLSASGADIVWSLQVV